MRSTFLLYLIVLFAVSCQRSPKQDGNATQPREVYLPADSLNDLIIYDTGSDSIVIIDSVSWEEVIRRLGNIQWTRNINIVALGPNDDYFIEVSGNTGDDGLSSSLHIDGEEIIADPPPASITEMARILESYYNRETNIIKKYNFH